VARQFLFAGRRGQLNSARGGLLAMVPPSLVLFGSFIGMRGTVSGLTDPADSVVAGLLVFIAAPTTWLFAALRLSPEVAIVLGVITSLPLWFLLGQRIAESAWNWKQWAVRYATWLLGWLVVMVLALVTVASIAS